MYKKEVLSNGLRVVTENIPHVKSAAIGFWIKCGSRYEPDNIHGISHFIEHMLFKGTSSRSAKSIAEEFESIGGYINAFTGREYTCVHARVLSEHLEYALEILMDMLQNSIFHDKEIEKEKNVVMEEIKMYEDTPDDSIHDFYTENVWNNHSLGKSILGNQKTIKDFSRDKIINYFNKYYTGKNIILSVSGNIIHEEIIKKVERLEFKNNNNNIFNVNDKLPIFHNKYIYKEKELEQTHFCIGTEGLSQNHKDIFALMLLNNILGGGVSSRLFQRIREELGWAYSVFSYQSIYKDKGLFTIYAGTSPKLAPKVVEEIINEIYKIKNKGVNDSELKRTKAQLKGNLYLSMESTSNRMSRLGRTELCYDRIITFEELFEKISKVESEHIQEIIEILFEDKLSFTAYGPAKYKFNIENIL